MKIDDKVIYVPRDKVLAGPWQPRRHFDGESLAELAASIKEHGILTPLTVSAAGNVYHLIAGERRLRAAAMAELAEVPCRVVYNATDDELRQTAIIDNLHREDLKPGEEALAIKTLCETGMKQDAIAAALGKSQAWVSQRLGLTKLPDERLQDLDNGVIKVEDARELVKLVKLPELMAMVLDKSTPGRRDYLPDYYYDERNSSYSVAYRVKEVLDKHSRLEEVEKKRLALEKEGKTVIRGYEPTGDTDNFVRLHDWNEELNVHEAAGLQCIAYYVSDQGYAYPYCTDPATWKIAWKASRKSGEGLSESEKMDRLRKEQARQRRRARDEVVTSWLSKKPVPGPAELAMFCRSDLGSTYAWYGGTASTVTGWLGWEGNADARLERLKRAIPKMTDAEVVTLWFLKHLAEMTSELENTGHKPEIMAWLASIGYVDPCPPETPAETEPEDQDPEEELETAEVEA